MNSRQAIQSLVQSVLEDMERENDMRSSFRGKEEEPEKRLGPAPARSMTLDNTPGHVASKWSGKSKKTIEAQKAKSSDVIPDEPGTAPIPNGHVRLYHQTSEENLKHISQHGITLSSARGIEGPKAIYADETGFYGKPTEKPTVEFSVPRERWSAPYVRADRELDQGRVAPENIIAIHYPWHKHARYIEKNPKTKQAVLAGEHNDLLNDRRYGQAISYIQNKYRSET